jgi:hypothetical protein
MLKPEQLAGVYRQVGADAINADGSTTTDEPRNSQIMYSPDGYMAVLSTPGGRKKLSGSDGRVDLNAALPEELAGAVRDLVCYAGRYILKDGVVEHHVDMALNPNLVGGVVIRRIDIRGADLTLSSVPAKDGSYRRIRWRRVT